MKLIFKIPLLIGIVVLLSAVAIIIGVDIEVRNSMEKTILSSMKGEARASADYIEAELRGQLNVLWEVANRARTRTMDLDVVRPSLIPDVQRLNSLEIGIVFPDGTTHYVMESSTTNLGDRKYIKDAFAGKNTVSDVLISRANGQPVVMFAAPIMQSEESNAPVIGVLVARKDGGKTLSGLVESIWTGHKSGYSFLLNEEGTVMGHKNRDLVLKQYNPIKAAETDESSKSMAAMVKTALREKEGIAEFQFEGKDIICAYVQVPGKSWILFSAMEKAEMNEELWRIVVSIATIGILFLIGGVIAAIIVGRFIAKPVTHIIDSVKDIIKDINQGKGDLTRSISVQSKDEIGELALNFNNLMETMRVPIAETKNVINDLTVASEELSKISNELAIASEKTVKYAGSTTSRTGRMSENINTMASGAEQASVNAGEVAGAAEQMSVNVNTIAAAIEQMSASIREIANNTSEVHHIATDATAKSTEATSVMSKLGAAAKEIGQVTDVIKRIADKTNLLALNATIEAASAGAAGKGFAVVAGEIKELANQSASSADDIARRIESIQTETSDAVRVINDVSKIIENINHSVETISTHIDQQNKTSNEIANNVAQANTGAKRVAGSIGEVAKGANDVSKNAGDAARRVGQVAEEVATMSDEANKSNQSASKLKSSASNLIAMADDLRNVMGKFKV